MSPDMSIKKIGLLREIGIYQRRYDCLVVLIVCIY